MVEAASGPKPKYPWQEAIFSALMEYHADRIRDKINAAERALCGRLVERPADFEELLALRDALFVLEIVFPELKTKADFAEKEEIARLNHTVTHLTSEFARKP